jgi:hypothetical protein
MSKAVQRFALDETKCQQILTLLKIGCSRRTAALFVGCSTATIRRTALRDPAFAAAINRAEGSVEALYLERIRNAARDPKYWRAAAWVLERRNPEDYALRQPDAITPGQLRLFLSQLIQVIVTEIPAASHRKHLIERLKELMHAAGQAPEPLLVEFEPKE